MKMNEGLFWNASHMKMKIKNPCLYLHWTCRYLSSFNPPRPVVNVSTGIEGNGPSPSAEARELLRLLGMPFKK